jgi:hypothetical protein
MVLDPWGDVVAEGDDSGRIDLARLSEVRTRFPFLADDRKFDRREAVIPTAEEQQKNRNEAADMFSRRNSQPVGDFTSFAESRC